MLPPAPGFCFVAGTKVLTPDGEILIQEIEIGTTVLAHDEPCGDPVGRPVIRVIRGQTTRLIQLGFGEETVTCTPAHPIYVLDKGWVRAGELQMGSLVPAASGEFKELTDINLQILQMPTEVYNFEVDRNHYYFVGGCQIFVHNGKM